MADLSKEDKKSIAQEIYDFFISVRFSPAAAAAMVAYADGVSGFDVGKSNGIFGIDKDRADVICNGNKQYPGCGIRLGKDTSVSAALEAIWFELRKTKAEALDIIYNAHNAFDAGAAISMYFAMEAESAAESLGLAAQKWFNSITGKEDDDDNRFNPSANEVSAEEKKNIKKDSWVLNANNSNRNTKTTANTDVADSTNHNISNVNWFDPKIAKMPDETTYLDTPSTSNTEGLDRRLTANSDIVKKVTVKDTETVNTATSVISANTVKNYESVDPANTVPKNSNRSRAEGDAHEEDFVTDTSIKSDRSEKAMNVEDGKEPPTEKPEKKSRKKKKENSEKAGEEPVVDDKNEVKTKKEVEDVEREHDKVQKKDEHHEPERAGTAEHFNFEQFYSNTEANNSSNTGSNTSSNTKSSNTSSKEKSANTSNNDSNNVTIQTNTANVTSSNVVINSNNTNSANSK